MKVFISWSGERSEAVAKGLRDWLPLVLHYVEPWLSKADIKAGERWGVEVAKELEVTDYGLICVTKDNAASPWLLFEAGALSKSIEDGRVVPLLLDIDFKEVSGPLAQFQAKKLDKQSLRELVIDMHRVKGGQTTEGNVQRLFEALWSEMESALASVPSVAAPPKPVRPQGEILEELVSGIRNVELRFRDLSEEAAPWRLRRGSHRGAAPSYDEVLEASRFLTDGRFDPIRLIILYSLVKESYPWLYELAVETYRSMTSFAKTRPSILGVEDKLLRGLRVAQRFGQLSEQGSSREVLRVLERETVELFSLRRTVSAEDDLSQRKTEP